MSTTTNPVAAAVVATLATSTVPTPKAMKTKTIALRDAGTGEILVQVISTKKDGWRVEVFVYTSLAKKGESRSGRRGATQIFGSDLAGALKAQDETVALLVNDGWVRPEPKPLGIERKADAFDLTSLPKPTAATPAPVVAPIKAKGKK